MLGRLVGGLLGGELHTHTHTIKIRSANLVVTFFKPTFVGLKMNDSLIS